MLHAEETGGGGTCGVVGSVHADLGLGISVEVCAKAAVMYAGTVPGASTL